MDSLIGTAPNPSARTAVAAQTKVATGAALYAITCQSCHGDQQGQGGIPAAPRHNETGHTWHHPDAQLKDWILNGKLGRSQMPGFKDSLSDTEVEEILAFIKSWWTDDQRSTQADVSVRYQEALEKYGPGQ